MDMMQISMITGIATAASTFFAFISVVVALISFNKSKKRRTYEKTIDISDVYANKVMPKVGVVHRALISNGSNEVKNRIQNYRGDLNFSFSEAKEIFGEKFIKDYLNSSQNIDIQQLALALYTQKLICIEYDICEKVDSLIKTRDDQATQRALQIEMQIVFSSIVSTTLNKLEAMCMAFNSGVAEPELAYQSLHQTFLSTVQLLYLQIARVNLDGSSKYYTHIIKLYNNWNNKHLACENREKSECERARRTAANNAVRTTKKL